MELAIALGLMPRDPALPEDKAKHVFRGDDPVGVALHACIEVLAAAEVLEQG